MIKNCYAVGNGLMACQLSISRKNSSLGHFRRIKIKRQIIWIFLQLLRIKVIVGEGIKCLIVVELKPNLYSSLSIYIKPILKLSQLRLVLQSDDLLLLSPDSMIFY